MGRYKITMKIVIRCLVGIALMQMAQLSLASSAHGTYVERHYAETADAPKTQSVAEANAKSAGCLSCHT
ncbi:MAG: hypothetical protein ACJA2O_001497, partial [Candidatus Azotimanducaceae bacterium]